MKISSTIYIRQIKLLSFMLVLTMSCHTSKKSSQEPVKSTELEQEKPIGVNDHIPIKWRVSVSFISIGEGIDPQALPKLEAYVLQFGKETGMEITSTRWPWGREGEVDNNFSLDKLSPGQQEKFIAGLMELFQGNPLVHITENQPTR